MKLNNILLLALANSKCAAKTKSELGETVEIPRGPIDELSPTPVVTRLPYGSTEPPGISKVPIAPHYGKNDPASKPLGEPSELAKVGEIDPQDSERNAPGYEEQVSSNLPAKKIQGSLVFYTSCDFTTTEALESKQTIDIKTNTNITVPNATMMKGMLWNYPQRNTTVAFYNDQGTRYAVFQAPNMTRYMNKYCGLSESDITNAGHVWVRDDILNDEMLFPTDGAYVRITQL